MLKSDNGSAFCAESFKAHLQRWRVWPLYSPPGAPWYNGAIEASIGSLKTRTRFIAHRHGHTAQWTSADLDQACDLANTTARPRGPRGPTPAEIWAVRQPPTFDERDAFAATVQPLECLARVEQGYPLDAPLDHYEQAELHRGVLTAALVQHGLLSMTWRRIPQRLFDQKVADFR